MLRQYQLLNQECWSINPMEHIEIIISALILKYFRKNNVKLLIPFETYLASIFFSPDVCSLFQSLTLSAT